MRLGLRAEISAGEDPAEILSRARRGGFDGVAWSLACQTWADASEPPRAAAGRAMREAAEAASVEALTLEVGLDFAQFGEGGQGSALAALTSAADFAEAAKICLLTLALDASGANPSGERLGEFLRDALKVVAERDQRLALRPACGGAVGSAAEACQLIEAMRSDRLLVILDPVGLVGDAPAAEQRGLISAAIDLLGGSLAQVHVRDRGADGAPAAPGHGIIDWDHVLSELRHVGFAGPLVVAGLGPEPAAETAVYLRERMA